MARVNLGVFEPVLSAIIGGKETSNMATGHIIELNDSYFVVLTPETVNQLGVRAGDEVQIDKLVQDVNRDSMQVEPTKSKPDLARQLAIARQVIADNRDALRELAK